MKEYIKEYLELYNCNISNTQNYYNIIEFIIVKKPKINDSVEIDFKRSLELNPNDPYVMNYLAYSWLDRKINVKMALELLKKAVDLEPSDGYIRDSLGWAYFLSKKFQLPQSYPTSQNLMN